MQKHDLVRLMKEKAEGVQAVVSELRTMQDVLQYAVRLTQMQGGRTMTGMGLEENDLKVLKHACQSAGIEFLAPPLKKNSKAIHTALIAADWGVAETGTLVLRSTSEDIRIATMLCETHVAILPSSKITPHIETLEEQLNIILKDKTPSYTAFITGASRTADIERVLAIGVHGPQELHILIVEDECQ